MLIPLEYTTSFAYYILPLHTRPWINAVNLNAVTTERANSLPAIRSETSAIWSRLFENESHGGWIVPTRGSSLDGSADDARETTLGNITTVADVITLLKCWREWDGVADVIDVKLNRHRSFSAQSMYIIYFVETRVLDEKIYNWRNFNNVV